MELTRWNPTRDMFSIRKQMNHLFDDVFRPVVRNDDSRLFKWDWHPTVDIYDNDENIIIKAELPGMDKKDIDIDVRLFRLPVKVDPEKINANYKDGILTIDIPKPEEQKPKQIDVH